METLLFAIFASVAFNSLVAVIYYSAKIKAHNQWIAKHNAIPKSLAEKIVSMRNDRIYAILCTVASGWLSYQLW